MSSHPLPTCRDVRIVMEQERRKVLQGCSLVFSRVMPLEQDPRTHALWRMAEQYGATCSTHCSDATTHVVAAARGTEKVGRCSLTRLCCGKHRACAPVAVACRD